MIATDKGQYGMVDAKGTEAVLELKDVTVGKISFMSIMMKTTIISWIGKTEFHLKAIKQDAGV